MSHKLKILKQKSMSIYLEYRCEHIKLDEYLREIKPLDEEIDKLELQTLSYYLEDNPVFEISSLKQIH